MTGWILALVAAVSFHRRVLEIGVICVHACDIHPYYVILCWFCTISALFCLWRAALSWRKGLIFLQPEDMVAQLLCSLLSTQPWYSVSPAEQCGRSSTPSVPFYPLFTTLSSDVQNFLAVETQVPVYQRKGTRVPEVAKHIHEDRLLLQYASCRLSLYKVEAALCVCKGTQSYNYTSNSINLIRNSCILVVLAHH